MTNLRLPNGIEIDTTTGKPVEGTFTHESLKADHATKKMMPRRVPTAAEARTNRHIRARLHDMPGDPRKVTATSVVLALYMFGLPDQDIAEATGFSIPQVEILRTTDLFDELHAKLLANVRQAAQDQVRVVMEEASMNAAEVMTEALQSIDEKVRVAAAKDVLDRTGHRPADVVEHKHSFEDEMRVRIIRDTPDDKTPILDLEVYGG